MGGAPSVFPEPWRELPQNKASLDFVKCYQPQNKEVKHLNIMLCGPAGAGKSSFINTVDSVLQNRVCVRAQVDANSRKSFTCKYKPYKFKKGSDDHYSLVFHDIMGLEQSTNMGVPVGDIKLALRGHVKDDYEFIPGHPLKEGSLDYNSVPTLQDKVHVLVCVIPALSVPLLHEDMVRKMRDIRLVASDMGIPQLVVLTKTDLACPEVLKDINNVYKSIYLKEQVDRIHMLLGIPLNSIFLVKNYSEEVQVNDRISALTLCALRQMISFGEDYLNNL